MEQTMTTLSLRVAHDLELVLLPADDRLLQEHLGGRARGQAGAGDAAQPLLVVGHARADAAHREARADDHRVAELAGRAEAVLERVADDRLSDGAAEVLDDLLELLAVLAPVDGLDGRADQLDAVLLQDPPLGQRDRAVERGLAAERRQQCVGALLGDHLLDEVRA